MTLPSGYRVPMRQVYTSSSTVKYEAADGSYMYLVLQGTNAPVLYMPNGTQYVYGATSVMTGGKRCSIVRDSNGNRINIVYGSNGSISTITDTLGRVLNFVYEPTYGHLMQITQNWLGQTHVLAQFDYALQPFSYNFSAISNVAVNAPTNNSQISVLTRVITNDGARHAFVYGGWGLVEDVFLYGALDNQRAAVDYAFPATSTALSDAPRFSQRNDGIYGFAGQWNTNLGWVANYFLFDANETWGKVRTPDGVVHIEQFNASGNQRGLSTGKATWTGTTDWQGGVRQRWSTTTWASDGTNYPVYPRATETNVYDNTDTDPDPENRRRTTMEYWQFTAAGTMPYTVYLPKVTKEYAADATALYRSAETDYLNNTNYWSRWIVGLPSQQRLKDGGGALQAQTSYGYDEAPPDTHLSSVLQHDTSTYGASLYTRGNLSSTRRHDITNVAVYTQTFAEYYITGNVARAYDPLNHTTKFYYDDAFATYADDANNTETIKTLTTKTWAYPTQVQDPDNFSSYVKYWYDTGAPTRTTDPKSAVALNIYETTYGRLAKAKNLVNNAYTSYVYDTGHNWVKTLSTVNSVSEETAVLSILDGAGRERQHVDEHPGSAGGLSSWYRVYDIMGRVVQWSNPTEIYGQAGCGTPNQPSCYLPWGDDYTGQYKFSEQTYDWNHRPLVTTNQDLTTRQISYAGCGCAGGQVTTLTDEVGRQQKAYADFLGRPYKTERWQQVNGSWSVYSTDLTTYNVRDQVTQTSLQEGTSGTSHIQTTQYDGYGRVWKRKSPLETTDMVYTYNNDDTVQQVKDARLATANYTYNARHLVTGITYGQPASNPPATDPLYVAPAPSTSFTYDAAGNRLTMTDGIGSVTYAYDTLSRMQSETRTITELSKTYSLSYNYNLAGQVKQVEFASDSFSGDKVTIDYGLDKTGRLTGITGSPFGGVTQYVSQINYRAFGRMKTMTYGNNYTSQASYTARIQLQAHNFKRPDGFALSEKTYSYYANDQLKFADDLVDNQFDRAYSYDHVGRIKQSLTGSQARNFIQGLPLGTDTVPYKLDNTYDVWGNRLTNTGKIWSGDVTETETYNSQTLRHDGWTYDNAGNVVNNLRNQMVYDAAGRNISFKEGALDTTQSHDGDGRVLRRDEAINEPVFYINSTVLGGKPIAEINGMGPNSIWTIPRGGKLRSYVYGGDTLVATQHVYPTSPTTPIVTWHHSDPLGGSRHGVALTEPYNFLVPHEEYDPNLLNVGLADPANLPPPPDDPDTPDYFSGGSVGWNPNKPTYYYNGIRIDEQFAIELLTSPSGAAVLDPRFAHDPMTLSRMGIFASWKWVKNAESQVKGYYDRAGEWVEGMGVEAGQHLAFTIDSAGGEQTAMAVKGTQVRMPPTIRDAQYIRGADLKVLERIVSRALDIMVQVPGCYGQFVSSRTNSIQTRPDVLLATYLGRSQILLSPNDVFRSGAIARTVTGDPDTPLQDAKIVFDQGTFQDLSDIGIPRMGYLTWEAELVQLLLHELKHATRRAVHSGDNGSAGFDAVEDGDTYEDPISNSCIYPVAQFWTPWAKKTGNMSKTLKERKIKLRRLNWKK